MHAALYSYKMPYQVQLSLFPFSDGDCLCWLIVLGCAISFPRPPFCQLSNLFFSTFFTFGQMAPEAEITGFVYTGTFIFKTYDILCLLCIQTVCAAPCMIVFIEEKRLNDKFPLHMCSVPFSFQRKQLLF